MQGSRGLGRIPVLLALAVLCSGYVLAADNSRHCSLFRSGAPLPQSVQSAGTGGCTSGNVILDGGFEAATGNPLDSPNWSEASTQFGSPLCDTGLCGTGGATAGPRTGTIWSWFGGAANSPEVASLSQSVTFPPAGGTATLNFYLWIGNVVAPFTDTLVIQVDGVTQVTINEPGTPEVGYTLRTVDLSTFADGAAHTINFLYTMGPGGGTGNFSVDDVTLDVVCPSALTADPTSLIVDETFAVGILNNGVLEMNETPVNVSPGWTNTSAENFTMTGVASAFTGPGDGVDATYTLLDPDGNYQTINMATEGVCFNCYQVSITGLSRDGLPLHSDATMNEDVTPVGIPVVGQPSLISKTWTVHIGNSFADVDNDIAVESVLPVHRDHPPLWRHERAAAATPTARCRTTCARRWRCSCSSNSWVRVTFLRTARALSPTCPARRPRSSPTPTSSRIS